MYDILIVDDDLFALAILEEQLKEYGDFFTPVYASNGKEAVEILNQADISLLVTDLIMPGDVNGWHLIEYIEIFYPHIPIVVITGCADQEKLRRLQPRVRHILLKPIKVDQLVRIVTNILNEDITSGSLKGISVGSFLQLLQIDGKTCLLEVGNSPKNKGLLYINQGKLYDAEYGDLREQEAARRLIALDNVSFQIKALPRIAIRRKITADLMSIIMEAMKLKDEKEKDRPQQPDNMLPSFPKDPAPQPAAAEPEPEAEEDRLVLDNLEDDDAEPQQQQAAPSPPPLPLKPQNVHNVNAMMPIEKVFEGLHCIKGYKAAALMNFTGEILVSDALDSTVELDNIGPLFNDVFRSAEEAAEKIGMPSCSEFVLKTSKGIIVMCCSGGNADVHFHLLSILDKDGNQALTKMQLAKLIPVVMKELV